MGKEAYEITGTVDRVLMVDQIRKAARQFAMQYFHFCKTLYDRYGHDVAKDIVRETVFNLAVDRSNQIREKSLAQGKKADTVADFMSDIDLPFEGAAHLDGGVGGAHHSPVQLLAVDVPEGESSTRQRLKIIRNVCHTGSRRMFSMRERRV